MNKNITSLALAALSGVALWSTPAVAAPSNAAAMSKIAHMVGTWDCNWKGGTASGELVATFTPVMNGAWLEETESVQSGEKTIVQTMHFTGYDPSSKRWIHAGPNADGTYEVVQSDDFATWKTLYPVAGGVGKLAWPSETEYILSEDVLQGGQTLTYVNDCKKRA